MRLTRLAHTLAAVRGVLACAFAAVLLASCSGSSVFGTLPASVRVFNALLDGGPIDAIVFVDPIASNLPFEGATTYQSVDAGNREVKVLLSGGTATIYDQTTAILDAGEDT